MHDCDHAGACCSVWLCGPVHASLALPIVDILFAGTYRPTTGEHQAERADQSA